MVRRWMVLVGLGTLAACGPPERITVMYPAPNHAARDVLDVDFLQQVTLPDLFVLRPDEFGAVAVDHRRNLIYAGSREGSLLALGLADGEVHWERKLEGAVGSVPRIVEDEDLLLVGTDNGVLHTIDLKSHESRWSYATEGVVRNPPVVRQGVVYFANSHQDVFALDLRDGRWRWQYTRDLPVDVSMIHGRAGLAFVPGTATEATNAGLLVTGFDDGKVVALGAASGEPLWVASVAPPEGGPFSDCDSTPLIDVDAQEVVVTGQETGVYGLSLQDGSERWKFPVRGAGTVVRGPGNMLIFASSLEGIFAIEPGGRLRWRTQTDPGVLSDPVIVDKTVFVTHSDLGLLALDAYDGSDLAVVDTGSGMSSVPVYDPAGNRFYAISNRGTLVAFRVGDTG